MQLVANRSSPKPSEPEVSFRARDLLRLRVVLDSVEPEDQIDRLLRDRRRRQRFVKIATQVRVARGASASRDLGDDVVAAIAIDDQRPRGAAEQPLRRLAATIAGEDVGDIVIAVLVGRDKRPDKAVLRLARAVVLF